MMALTDRQLALVKTAAALLPTDQRETFLQSIANRLADSPPLTDAGASLRIGTLCNVKPEKENNNARFSR